MSGSTVISITDNNRDCSQCQWSTVVLYDIVVMADQFYSSDDASSGNNTSSETSSNFSSSTEAESIEDFSSASFTLYGDSDSEIEDMNEEVFITST